MRHLTSPISFANEAIQLLELNFSTAFRPTNSFTRIHADMRLLDLLQCKPNL